MSSRQFLSAVLACILCSSALGFGISPPIRLFPPSHSRPVGQEASIPFPPSLLYIATSTSRRTTRSSLSAPPRMAAAAGFDAQVNGEWIGFESEFGASDGVLRNVPDHQMPSSLLDWGVVLTGYEHLSSTGVSDGQLRIRRTRLLPSVGCAVDAVPHDKFETVAALDAAAAAFFPDGAFSLGPDKLGGNLATPLAHAPRPYNCDHRLLVCVCVCLCLPSSDPVLPYACDKVGLAAPPAGSSVSLEGRARGAPGNGSRCALALTVPSHTILPPQAHPKLSTPFTDDPRAQYGTTHRALTFRIRTACIRWKAQPVRAPSGWYGRRGPASTRPARSIGRPSGTLLRLRRLVRMHPLLCRALPKTQNSTCPRPSRPASPYLPWPSS